MFHGNPQRLSRLTGSHSGTPETVTSRLSSDLVSNPQLADAISKQIDDLLKSGVNAGAKNPAPPDNGLAALVGVRPRQPKEFGQTRVPAGVQACDGDRPTSERIIAVGDMYYLYQHEKIGVFRVQKLQELFHMRHGPALGRRGRVRLYQFDRREVLRYTMRDRIATYRRNFGYGSGPGPAGSRPNTDFHPLFTRFVHQVTLFRQDKRISDVIRERAYDPSFGSIAIVRRFGLDLRNNVKWLSFGHLNVMRVEDSGFGGREAPVRRRPCVGRH